VGWPSFVFSTLADFGFQLLDPALKGGCLLELRTRHGFHSLKLVQQVDSVARILLAVCGAPPLQTNGTMRTADRVACSAAHSFRPALMLASAM
jgi:hypothetical protein